MKWFGPMARMIFAVPPDPEIARLLDEQRATGAQVQASRRRLEKLAGDPMEATLNELIEDLHQC